MITARTFLLCGALLLMPFLQARAITTASAELGLGDALLSDAQTCSGLCTVQFNRDLFPPTPFSYYVGGASGASAEFGTLKASATTTALGVHTSAISTGAKAAAGFQDFFTIDGGPLNGTMAKLTVPLSFNWSFTGTSSGGGVGLLGIAEFSVLLDPNLGSSKTRSLAFREDFNGSGSLGGSGLETIGFSSFAFIPFTNTPVFTLDFQFGQPIKVKADLKITIAGNDFNIEVPGTAPIADFLVQLDAGHSAYWGGIQAVTDADGNPVPFTVTSVSGHDWLQSSIPQPVPLPASAGLLLFGAGAVGAFQRRTRARRRPFTPARAA
ncbi:MAG: PEP-CTERM sorting domain-containing protein [Gammaproteobacteria bacterium]